ncbi:DNA/RNA non-specific endonuclease [Arcicella sp. LKC2W]|uniref:DNA/RNA non-specific endonuclease n=1 Tax=Arcicella sp. LKC2W TaxID=2984198 RepID=UPI002B2034BA|nr:DNA/RNA non-specific endonuclease [Arcicella sp. LKC2W]MEA5457494.1 DNA/RNA non-specific endonuclease [Arcicella sp. LKC2W]
MSKIKFLIFLFFLGIVLYYFGKPEPMQSLKNDFNKVFGNTSKDAPEPWTRAGRGDTVATDDGTSIAEDIGNKVKEKIKEKVDEEIEEKETSLFDIFKSKKTDNDSDSEEPSTLDKYIPYSKKNTDIIRHNAFILSYQEEYELASWVLHRLVKDAAYGHESRSNEFISDPLVESGSAVTQDYSRSGYDRGHLCPAGDFRHDKALQDETFYMSNMAPQVADFNRGIWSDLENKIRSWVKKRGELIVVTGPILKKGLPTIGRMNQIAVPEKFYKIIYDPATEEAIAFLFPNEGSVELVKSFTISIDELETMTGIDFFAKLPDSIEQKIERENNVDDWY